MYPLEHDEQSPFESQAEQPVLFPLEPQQWPPQHAPLVHRLFEEHAAPSDFIGKHSPLILVYPLEHDEQSPFESQAVHPVAHSSFFAWYVAQAEYALVEAVDLLVHMAQLFATPTNVPVTMPVHDASARHCARHCSRVLMVFVLQAVTHSDW